MYTDEDLSEAVEKGVFTAASVEQFRAEMLAKRQTFSADEEDFKLLTSFNDIFVVIACVLLLLSAAWVIDPISESLATLTVALISWGLAEFFVLKRKMALPAIVLLISFVGGMFATVVTVFGMPPNENSLTVAGLAAAAAAWLHWRRFRVPITVAAGVLAMVTFAVSLVLSFVPDLFEWLMALMFIGGLIVFAFAMRWDMADLQRVTGYSDVAFWLHLTAAPMMVHPVFSSLGIFDGDQSTMNLVLVMVLYLVLTVISLVIDRRAFMVSALIYVLVALTQLLETYGVQGDSFAYVGVVIGFSLLMLSGFWHHVRLSLISVLPEPVRKRVPTHR
jgi:hypothetical protein